MSQCDQIMSGPMKKLLRAPIVSNKYTFLASGHWLTWSYYNFNQGPDTATNSVSKGLKGKYIIQRKQSKYKSPPPQAYLSPRKHWHLSVFGYPLAPGSTSFKEPVQEIHSLTQSATTELGFPPFNSSLQACPHSQLSQDRADWAHRLLLSSSRSTWGLNTTSHRCRLTKVWIFWGERS